MRGRAPGETFAEFDCVLQTLVSGHKQSHAIGKKGDLPFVSAHSRLATGGYAAEIAKSKQ